MREKIVKVSRQIKGLPSLHWQRLAAFDVTWHPDVATCRLDFGHDGALDRIFKDNSGQEYQERLTYLSQTEGVMRYRMIAGIEAAELYEAEVSLSPIADQTKISWRAKIRAAPDRLEGICAGTTAIFNKAIETLETLSPLPQTRPDNANIDPISMNGAPTLTGLKTNSINAEAPLIIFLHGIGGNANNWRPQLSAIGASFPSVALNLRGYGGSRLGAAQTRLEDHFQDILRTAKYFGQEQFVLIGLSYGAWIATAFAQAHPTHLLGLVLAGGCTGMSEASQSERQAFLNARLDPLNKGLAPKDFAQDVVDLIAGPHATSAERAELLRSMESIPKETYRDALNCFCNPPETHDFSKIKAPTYLLTGTHDKLAPPSEIKSVANRMLDTRSRDGGPILFDTIQDAGHLCNIENADTFNVLLTRFLNLSVASRN